MSILSNLSLRRTAAAAAALGVLSIGAVPMASAAETHDFPAKTAINGRAEIGQPADAPGAKVDIYAEGDMVPVECQQEHEGELWAFTADDVWIPDSLITTGTDGFAEGVPRCDAGEEPQGERPVGVDVSVHNGEMDFSAEDFVIAKATEGTSYVNEKGEDQVAQAREAGAVVGRYHWAWPGSSSGTEQADYFIEHGGGWTGDGQTLPGALDLENSEGEDFCYGQSPEEMVAWIREFSDRYEERTGRKPMIYTRASWWDQCTGGSTEFGDHPLWIAHYQDSPDKEPTLPAGWDDWTIYQWTEEPHDKNVLNGTDDDLDTLVNG